MATLVCAISTVLARSWAGGARSAKNKLSIPTITVLTFLLAIFSGLRYKVGSDYSMYAYFYEIVDPTSLRNSLELVPQESGFVLLMMACRLFSDDPRMLFTIASIITVSAALVAIRRLSVHPTFSVFLYFFLTYYTLSLNAVRQSIAVSLFMLGESYRGTSKFRWILFSVLAMIFHTSTIIAFVIQVAITRWKPRPASSILLLIVGTPLFIVVINTGPVRSWLSGLNPRYESYFSVEGGGMGTMLILGVRMAVIVWGLIELSRRYDAAASKYLAMVIVSAFALLLGLSSWVFARFEPFFGIYLVLLIPALLRYNPHKKILQFLISVCVLVYFGIHISNFNELIPYQMDPG